MRSNAQFVSRHKESDGSVVVVIGPQPWRAPVCELLHLIKESRRYWIVDGREWGFPRFEWVRLRTVRMEIIVWDLASHYVWNHANQLADRVMLSGRTLLSREQLHTLLYRHVGSPEEWPMNLSPALDRGRGWFFVRDVVVALRGIPRRQLVCDICRSRAIEWTFGDRGGPDRIHTCFLPLCKRAARQKVARAWVKEIETTRLERLGLWAAKRGLKRVRAALRNPEADPLRLSVAERAIGMSEMSTK